MSGERFVCVTCRREYLGLAVPLVWEADVCAACAGPDAGPGVLTLQPFVCDRCLQQRTGRRHAATLSSPQCQECHDELSRAAEVLGGGVG
jgi:hypothetical protein